MIDDKTKRKLLRELEKSGNIYFSCARIGVERSAFYRWHSSDEEFKKLADLAVNRGRENNCDIAEQALLLNVKEKRMDAIKYVLGHNSPRYKENVIIWHKKEEPEGYALRELTFMDMVKNYYEHIRKQNIRLKEKYENMGGIPAKADGTEIENDELFNYETYIEEWYKKKKIEENNK